MRDEDLRRFGFEIVARPRCGPTTWRHCVSGLLLSESEAIALIDSRSPQALRMQHAAELQREGRGR